MNCEICGKKIIGKPIHISIERSLLVVCQGCSNYGTVVDKKAATSFERTLPKPGLKTPKQKKVERTFEEFVLVENFGDLIKKGREALGFSREEFAKKLGEKESVIRRIEAEEMYPPPSLTSKIERLLKISLKTKIDESVKGDVLTSGSLTLGDVAILKEGRNN